MSEKNGDSNGQEPRFTVPAINQTITYRDGSSIQIIVSSWPDEDMDDRHSRLLQRPGPGPERSGARR